jgi:putative spermidine/putrescine transport system substrate-binding protein
MLKKFGFITMVVFLFSAIVLSACGSDKQAGTSTDSAGNTAAASKDKSLVISDWGGVHGEALKKAIYEPFEKKFGVKITQVTPPDYGKIKAMVDNKTVEWDIATVESGFVLRGGKEGLLEKLDYNVIKKDDVGKEFVYEYGISYDFASLGIGYGTKTFSTENHPKNWTEFWDTAKFPGPRSMQKTPVGTLEQALFADGVTADKLYPLDVDRAFKSLDKIKKDVKVWWTTNAQAPQLLANGEAVLSTGWFNRFNAAKNNGAQLQVDFNQAIISGDSFVVPKGSSHKDLAMQFIAFAIEPEQQAAFSKIALNTPTNNKALELLPKELVAQFGRTPELAKVQIVLDDNYWNDNYDKLNERFQEWLLK